MKKIVVTGAKGGTGTSIVALFRQVGYRVSAVDLKPPSPDDRDYCQLDVERGAGVHDVLAGAAAVVHFGSLPTDQWTSAEAAFRNLVLGGFNVLQAAANLRVPRIVLASSPMVYAPYARHAYLPIDEESPQAPRSLYGAAKQNLESLASHYARWHGLAIASLRPQRIVYEGSYEWRFRRYTDNDTAAAEDLWAYVDARDVASACLAWVESDRQGFEAFNLAADDVCVATPTRDLLRRFYSHVHDVRGGVSGNAGLVDCRKARTMLAWRPVYHWRAMAEESDSAAPAR
ncbi:MAG: NAD(P)-dependent oxidoreductase [Planctomycetia bacterium]|nr:NAD(P)-dependent oxidoreductase [Planctomycetia bacterium]